ncbi:MAG TPA: hypothetical protein PKM88_07225 [bacterium]|nr:hypothetical protein [bacterium]
MREKMLCAGAYALIGAALFAYAAVVRWFVAMCSDVGLGLALPARICVGVSDVLTGYGLAYVPLAVAGWILLSLRLPTPALLQWIISRTSKMLLYGFAAGILAMTACIAAFVHSAYDLPTAVGR